MPYQVLGGPTKDAEFELYVKALRECGISPEAVGGRIGVVNSVDEAEQILRQVKEKIPHLSWTIVELPAG